MQVYWLLVMRQGSILIDTYHTERANKLLWWLHTRGDDHLDEVGGDADDDDHADSLQNADEQKHLAQRHGSVAWDRHDG
jgi:hypothetical protein